MAKRAKPGRIGQDRRDALPTTRPLDKFAVSAFVISLAAMLISAGSLFIQWQGYKATLDEVVTVSLRSWSKSPHIKISRFGDEGADAQGLLEVDGELGISNNGARKISITRYEVWVVSEKGGRKSKGWHIGLDEGLFDLKGNEVEFPLYLEPGESRILLARVGTIIPNRSFVRLERLAKVQPLQRYTLLEALTDGGVDAHGNAVEVVRRQHGGVLKKVSSKSTSIPKVVIRVYTGQENQFDVETEWNLFL